MKNNSFAGFALSVFIFGNFADILVLSTMLHELFVWKM